MTNLGIQWLSESATCTSVRRQTRESDVTVTIADAPRRDFEIDTSINFFNHMLETIAWRGCFNLDVRYTNTQFRLTHVIAEDVGIVFGMALGRLVALRTQDGVEGAGSALLGIDEALAVTAVSFEGRSCVAIDLQSAPGSRILQVEDALSADLKEFFAGFAQGARCTVNIQALSGQDPHHSWEAIYRSFGQALKNSLQPNLWRAGTTAGVKGILS